MDQETLAAIGSVIVGFGITALVFRLQRELQMGSEGRPVWIPWADRLLIGVVTVSILFILLPIALVGETSILWGGRVPAAACSGLVTALAGYIPALLAHYRFGPARKWIWFGPKIRGPRVAAGEPSEKLIVLVSVLLGVAAAVLSFLVTGSLSGPK